MSVFTKLNSVINEKGSAYVVLIDPDRKNEDSLESHVDSANNSNVQHKSAYGNVKSQSYGVVNPDNTTGPHNLGPYPNAVSQTGGKRF